jgi:hypothetical protein
MARASKNAARSFDGAAVGGELPILAGDAPGVAAMGVEGEAGLFRLRRDRIFTEKE